MSDQGMKDDESCRLATSVYMDMIEGRYNKTVHYWHLPRIHYALSFRIPLTCIPIMSPPPPTEGRHILFGFVVSVVCVVVCVISFEQDNF